MEVVMSRSDVWVLIVKCSTCTIDKEAVVRDPFKSKARNWPLRPETIKGKS